MKAFKWLVAAVAIIIIGALVWFNIRSVRGEPASAGAAPEVFTMPIAPGVFMDRVSAQANIQAADTTILRAPFASPRVAVKAAIGDAVTAGDVLMILDTADLLDDILKRETAVRSARAALDKALLDARFAPEDARRRLEQAAGRVRDLTAALEKTRRDADESIANARSELTRAEAALAASDNQAEVTAARRAAETALQALAADPSHPDLARAYKEANARYLQLEADAAAKAVEAQQALDRARAAVPKAEADRVQNVRAAEAALAEAELDYGRRQLEAQTGQGEDPVAEARRALTGAEEALAAALQKRDEATVAAPFSGVVLSIKAQDGQAVSAGGDLLTVGRLDEMEIGLSVDESDVAKLAKGQPIMLHAQAFPDTIFEGEVTFVPLQAGSSDGNIFPGRGGSTFMVTGLIQNPDNKLRIGMNAQAEITTAHKEGVILIGLEALRQDGGPHVFVLDGTTARRRDVMPGITSRTEIEIIDGLNDGDILIIGPFPVVKELHDGQEVKPDLPDFDGAAGRGAAGAAGNGGPGRRLPARAVSGGRRL